MHGQAQGAAARRHRDVMERLPAVVSAMLLGVFILYGVGFAQPAAIHNAAHDSRHSFAFPCH